jgi:hypothetical protein
VFNSTYLGTSLPDIGDTLILVINFDVGACILTVTATGTQPSINPTSRTWVLGSVASANTTINWGCAVNNVAGIEDDDGDPLGDPADYTVVDNGDGTGNLTITNAYLAAELLVVGASTKLTIDFDCGNDATFTITAAAAPAPGVSPTSLIYLLGSQANITTNIIWGSASTISSVKDVTSLHLPVTLSAGVEYLVSGDTLVISGACNNATSWGGLECRLDASARLVRVLEITFNTGAKATLMVNSGGFTAPSLSSTALTYDLSRVSDPTYLYAVALITWGTATNVNRICQMDALGNCACNLTGGVSYMCSYVGAYASYAILFLKDSYLKVASPPWPYCGANLTKIGQSVKVTVYWTPNNKSLVNNCPIGSAVNSTYAERYAPTLITITATGTGASISPVKADFNLDAPANVTTTITWGSFTTSVAKVMNGIDVLTNGVDYAVSGNTVAIASSYLSSLGLAVDDQVVLTIVWDQGTDSKFTITAIGTPLCFIATAVGEDDASLDILRAFRDDVLRPNAPWLVSLYYKVSPSIAKVIAGNEVLKAAVKAGVDLIVDILS